MRQKRVFLFIALALMIALTMGITAPGPPAEDTTTQAQIIDFSKMTPEAVIANQISLGIADAPALIASDLFDRQATIAALDIFAIETMMAGGFTPVLIAKDWFGHQAFLMEGQDRIAISDIVGAHDIGFTPVLIAKDIFGQKFAPSRLIDQDVAQARLLEWWNLPAAALLPLSEKSSLPQQRFAADIMTQTTANRETRTLLRV